MRSTGGLALLEEASLVGEDSLVVVGVTSSVLVQEAFVKRRHLLAVEGAAPPCRDTTWVL